MLIWQMLKLAIRTLAVRKLRTGLTMLGIVVGVGSVIIMLAYGEGQKNELLARFEGWSERQMYIRFSYWSWRGNLTVPRSVQMKGEDARLLVDSCSAISLASPEASAHVEVKSSLYSEDHYRVNAVSSDHFTITGDTFLSGRAFTYEEDFNQERVCVIGELTKDKYFMANEAVDDYLTVGGKRYRVVGVTRKKGLSTWFADQIYIPWNTGRKRTELFDRVHGINVQLVSTKYIQLGMRQIREQLHLEYPELPVPDDLFDDELSPIMIRSVGSRMAEREQTADSFALLLRVIGALSLLIGGVGVMNIMLVTVHERTAEIGLRKALGARRRDIMAQFIVEALVICICGGIIGTGVAWLACRYLARLPAEANVPDPVITSVAILVAVVVTLGTGFFFGVYPAGRAARLDPIVALHDGR